MRVRRAVKSDLEAMHPLLEQLMHGEFTGRQTMWGETFEHAGYAAWVAEVNGELGGFIDLFVFPDVAHGGKVGLINTLVVDERFRRRGLGEGLLREAIHHSGQQGAIELHVWTDASNQPAIGLYRRLGFVDRAMLLELQVRPEPSRDGPTPGSKVRR